LEENREKTGIDLPQWCTLKYTGTSVKNEYTPIRGEVLLFHKDTECGKDQKKLFNSNNNHQE